MAAPAPRDAKRARPAALEARVSTIELPGLDIHSVLAGKGGKVFLGTASALYLHVHGHLTVHEPVPNPPQLFARVPFGRHFEPFHPGLQRSCLRLLTVRVATTV